MLFRLCKTSHYTSQNEFILKEIQKFDQIIFIIWITYKELSSTFYLLNLLLSQTTQCFKDLMGKCMWLLNSKLMHLSLCKTIHYISQNGFILKEIHIVYDMAALNSVKVAVAIWYSAACNRGHKRFGLIWGYILRDASPITGNVNDYVMHIYSKYADLDPCGPGWEEVVQCI